MNNQETIEIPLTPSGEKILNDQTKIVWHIVSIPPTETSMVKDEASKRIQLRREAKKKLREAVGTYDLSDWQPPTKDEIYER